MGHWEPCSDVEAVAARESGVEVQAEHHVGHKDWRDIDGVVGHQIPCWRGSGALIHAVGRHFRRWVAGDFCRAREAHNADGACDLALWSTDDE